MLGETYLTVHQWTKFFNHRTTDVKTTMAWVQLPDLPIEFFNPVAVKRIASRIRRPIRFDRVTEEGARGKYVRVCVEVDLTKPLLSKYLLEGRKYLISYEGLQGLCTACGMYKSPSSVCRCYVPQELAPKEATSDVIRLGEDIVEKAMYGVWMNASTKKQSIQKYFQSKAANREVKPSKPVMNTSVPIRNRFESLNTESEADPL
ncbi:hypothetical protein LINGRAHAP2_LOCUS31137 [Linum grandiflorum]